MILHKYVDVAGVKAANNSGERLRRLEQQMRDADAIFQQMDASDTPGTRASIDRCEVKIERSAG